MVISHLFIEKAWTLPMGSISRMIRAQSTHSPGHITDVGMGTFIDPDIAGGAINERATKSPLHSKLVSKIEIAGETTLMYKALPIQVALIRGTTGKHLIDQVVFKYICTCTQIMSQVYGSYFSGFKWQHFMRT